MEFHIVEEMFNRAWSRVFSKSKFFLAFFSLLICGTLIVFFRALSFATNSWFLMSFSFFPIFLCLGILLVVGILLTRIYYQEMQGKNFPIPKLFIESFEVLLGSAYLSIPMVMLYIFLWTLMGAFYLLKSVPFIGEGIGILCSFAPFLLLLASLILALFNVLILFYATPHIALKKTVRLQIIEEVLTRLKISPLINILLLGIGIAPIFLALLILSLAALLTGIGYTSVTTSIALSLQWFFMMLPFAFFLTPFIVFFFNFSAESFRALQKKTMVPPNSQNEQPARAGKEKECAPC